MFLVGAAVMATVAVVRRVETSEACSTMSAPSAGLPTPAERSQQAGAPLANLPGSADLVVVEFRAWFSHAAPVLPSRTPSTRRTPSGVSGTRSSAAAFIPTFMVFGLLCRRFPLKTLLLWGTVVAVPQMVPLLFIHSVTGALIAAVPVGLMGGVATAAYLDLLIRSCPPGLQGTTLMMSGGLYFIASRFGDVLGTNLYGYDVALLFVIAITVVYALILPTFLLVPKRLIATADGQMPDFNFAAG